MFVDISKPFDNSKFTHRSPWQFYCHTSASSSGPHVLASGWKESRPTHPPSWPTRVSKHRSAQGFDIPQNADADTVEMAHGRHKQSTYMDVSEN